MEKIKNNLWCIVLSMYILFALWFGITRTIQAYKCPKMTNTELFLNTDNSFLLNFKECEND
jgi:hypothetical protein